MVPRHPLSSRGALGVSAESWGGHNAPSGHQTVLVNRPVRSWVFWHCDAHVAPHSCGVVSVTCAPSVQEAERLRLRLQEHATQPRHLPLRHRTKLLTVRQGTGHSLFVLQELCPAKFSSRGCAPAPCQIAVRACGPEQGGFEGQGRQKVELILQAAAKVTRTLILHASVTLLIDTGPCRYTCSSRRCYMRFCFALRATERTPAKLACPTPAGQYGSSARGRFRFCVRISMSL